jgi:hypothetical protein
VTKSNGVKNRFDNRMDTKTSKVVLIAAMVAFIVGIEIWGASQAK